MIYHLSEIPIKNGSKHLRLAIQPCKNQIDQNFEIIISDNNSSDNTRDVCKSLNYKFLIYLNMQKDLPVRESFENSFTYAVKQI